MALTQETPRVLAPMQALVACLCTELGQVGWTGTCCVEPGETAHDTCCEGGGKAWVRLISIFPTDRYPFQGSPVDLAVTEPRWAARLELGAVTCADDSSCGAAEDSARAVASMAEAALRAVVCCAQDDGRASDLRVGGLTLTGPEGMCGGFTMEVFAALEVCCNEPC